MLKVFNISTLILFVCFLFAPTIAFALNKDVDTSTFVINEEEETHSKTKTKKGNNNNLNEEEEQQVHYHFFNNNQNLIYNPGFSDLNLISLIYTIKDDLVFKIPLPPPEQHL